MVPANQTISRIAETPLIAARTARFRVFNADRDRVLAQTYQGSTTPPSRHRWRWQTGQSTRHARGNAYRSRVFPKKDKKDGEHVTAMRFAGTEKGVLMQFRANNSEREIYWLDVWVANDLAAAISAAFRSFGWPKLGIGLARSDDLVQPKRSHLAHALEVNSLSTSAERGRILLRFAVGHRIRVVALFLLTAEAHQLVLAIVRGAEVAAWWDDEFELVPSRESQH
jgi:hypothetical protein